MKAKHSKPTAVAKAQKIAPKPMAHQVFSPYGTPQFPTQGRITRTAVLIRQWEFRRGKQRA